MIYWFRSVNHKVYSRVFANPYHAAMDDTLIKGKEDVIGQMNAVANASGVWDTVV
jgi:hypothetical protein